MKNGYTLIELIIAIFIFSILTTIASGGFVSTLSLQRKALNIKRVEENGRFILEMMAREIRLANPINSPDTNCPTSNSVLNFQHPINGNIEYSLIGNIVHRKVNGVDSIISGSDVEILRLNFCISGNTPNDGKQPKVTIILSLKSGGGAKEAVILDLQTTVSQRILAN